MAKMEIIKRPVEKIGGDLKQSAWMSAAESLATIILGIILAIWPETAVKVIAYIVGAFFVIKGAYQVINYFIVKGQNDFFNNNLLGGVVSVLIGVAALVMGQEIAQIFRIIIGIWMIYESLVRMNTAIKLHAANIAVWKYILLLALGMMVLGVFITFYDGAIFTLVGWTMIAIGIIGVVGDIMFIQHVNSIVEKLTNLGNNEKL